MLEVLSFLASVWGCGSMFTTNQLVLSQSNGVKPVNATICEHLRCRPHLPNDPRMTIRLTSKKQSSTEACPAPLAFPIRKPVSYVAFSQMIRLCHVLVTHNCSAHVVQCLVTIPKHNSSGTASTASGNLRVCKWNEIA